MAILAKLARESLGDNSKYNFNTKTLAGKFGSVSMTALISFFENLDNPAEVAKETEVRMFAKTSTGFGKPKDWNTPVGATVEDVWLMHEEIKPLQEQGVVIGIKAAGGIKDARSVIQMMLAAGCFNDDLTLKKIFLDLFRVGASAGKAIIEDFRKNFMS